LSDIHPSIFDIVPSVARSVFNRFRNWVEFSDIKQECYTFAASRQHKFKELLDEPDVDKRMVNERKVAWQIKRAAERYARKEKASKSGYQTTDEAYYESASIGQLLPFVIASVIDGTVLEQVQQMVQDGQPKGKSSPAEGGNLLATLIDIKRGYLELDQDEQKLLRLRHHESFTLQQIAQVMECAVSTADRKCNNAMRKLIDKLGGQSPWQ